MVILIIPAVMNVTVGVGLRDLGFYGIYQYISCYYLQNMEIRNIYDASQVKTLLLWGWFNKYIFIVLFVIYKL